ncbi:hypothetical protein SAMN02745165_01881 [Malonomonas rubra DSM 5091]|uniref:Uncharacterized protein n=1 Tax=Malonomonas rubra DSM 5091 TaxID=1122189 RepID=A0A1M6HLX7_MALRU|nr:DUF2057 domain-containing protein [Malonomonas rubra]SHJ23182.1 hypothetical protein SAMN02745165_01881 [Malonomonas rubra DSM 5091]
MKPLASLTLFGMLCLSTTASAEVALNLPENVKLLAANGKNTEDSNSVELPDGTNQIAVRFKGELKASRNDFEIMSSDVFVVTFNANNTRLSMQPWNIHKAAQLKEFNQQPKIVLTDSHGKTITRQIDKLEKEGFQLMRDYARELAAFNKSDSPAALKLTAADKQPQTFSRQPVASHQPAPSQQAQQSEQAQMAEQMLYYWYNQADQETRERFKAWLKR